MSCTYSVVLRLGSTDPVRAVTTAWSATRVARAVQTAVVPFEVEAVLGMGPGEVPLRWFDDHLGSEGVGALVSATQQLVLAQVGQPWNPALAVEFAGRAARCAEQVVVDQCEVREEGRTELPLVEDPADPADLVGELVALVRGQDVRRDRHRATVAMLVSVAAELIPTWEATEGRSYSFVLRHNLWAAERWLYGRDARAGFIGLSLDPEYVWCLPAAVTRPSFAAEALRMSVSSALGALAFEAAGGDPAAAAALKPRAAGRIRRIVLGALERYRRAGVLPA